MSEDQKPSKSVINYAAHLLRRMTDSSATDPGADDIKRLTGPLFELMMSIYSEGRDKTKRKARMNAEISARGLEFLKDPIEQADPQADLHTLQSVNGWSAFDLADVVLEDVPPIEWIVKFFLSRPSVIVMFGRAKHKKTLAVMDMALHIASGLPWMASDPSGREGIDVAAARIVWIDLENGARLMKRRIKAFAKALGAEIPHGQFLTYSLPDPWLDLSKPENVPAMIERIQTLGGAGVLVVDHLAQVFGAIDENSPLASQIMGAIRQISEATNTGIILIHHSKKGIGKDGGMIEDQLRGSGAILAGVDAAFLVERDPIDKNQVTIKPVAVRGPDAPTISARFAYEQDENLDLTAARFWRIAYRNVSARAHDAILRALKDGGKMNHTELRSAAKKIDESLTDASIREGISTLEGTKEIFYIKGDKGAKLYELNYELAGDNENE